MYVALRFMTGLMSGLCCLSMMVVAAEYVFHVPAHDVMGFRHLLAPLLPMAVVVAVTDLLVLGRARPFRYGSACFSLFLCLVLLVVANTWRDGMNRDHHAAIKLLWDGFTFRSGGWWIVLVITAHMVMVRVILNRERLRVTDPGTSSSSGS